MSKNIGMFACLIIVLGLIFAACGDDDNSTGPGGLDGYVTATITHWGFDFSTAKNDTSNWGQNNDGETIVWTPIGERKEGGIWFRTRVYPNRTQSKGQIDITSIKSIDTSESAWDTQPAPLSKNDVVIAQCNDGFVKFLVIADVDTSQANPDWSIQVKYLFSPTASFNQ
jgi:hypothetical protein